ncbi:hypothetical protein HY251_19150 [bacterium]|nr:hypothetical protein [bacterium]
MKLPLAVALVPDPDVWRVSGAGRTLIARRRANGRIAWASLTFDLKRPGSMVLFGNLEAEEGAFEEILDALYQIEDARPVIGGEERLASRFTFGAFAWARSRGCDLGEVEPELLAVFGRPIADDAALRGMFSEQDGLCTKALLERCREEADAALPEGQSLAVRVVVAFRLAQPSAFRRALEVDQDFQAGKERDGNFSWRPECAGSRELGLIALDSEGLAAETVSLDLGGRLCARVKRLAEGGAELLRAELETP